jgi:uncharacterized RDD family membrane protein YckC
MEDSLLDKAGFLARFVAWIVDAIAVAVLLAVFTAAIGLLGGQASGAGGDPRLVLGRVAAPLGTMLLPMIQFLYFGYVWSHGGQSMGMRLLSLKVIRRRQEPLTFLRAGFRGTVGYWLSGLVLGLGYLWAAVDANREAWHDKVFDTWVVRA